MSVAQQQDKIVLACEALKVLLSETDGQGLEVSAMAAKMYKRGYTLAQMTFAAQLLLKRGSVVYVDRCYRLAPPVSADQV